MYGESALLDQFDDLRQADLAAVESFCGDSRREITIDDAKENGFEYGSVVGVERTVYEDALVVAGGRDVF